jgi:hypothetical protein
MMLAIGNDELGKKVQREVFCRGGCGKVVKVEPSEGKPITPGVHKSSVSLEWYRCECNGSSYLVGMNGREINRGS